MRMPRLRFRLRTLMVAVVAVGVVLTIEPQLVRLAIDYVAEEHGERYIVREAVLAWIALHILLLVTISCVIAGLILVRTQRPPE